MLTLVLIVLATASSTPRGDPAILKQEAARRFQAGDWCGALYYLDGMLAVTESEKVLLNSARAAVSGGDLVRGLGLYERLQTLAPSFMVREVAAELLDLRQRIGLGDISQSCPLPAATCGNALVEGTEACDDGGVIGGDGCDPGCAVEVAAPPPAPAPPTAVAPPPVVVVPPVDAQVPAAQPTRVVGIVGLSTVAIGAVGLLAGGVLGVLKLAADDAGEVATSAAETRAADDASAAYALAANITLGTSLGVGVLGGALWAWDAWSGDKEGH